MLQLAVRADHPGQGHAGPDDRQAGFGDHLRRQLRGPRKSGGRGQVAMGGPGRAGGPHRTGEVDHARAHVIDADLQSEPGRPGPVELQRVGRPAGPTACRRQLGDQPIREQLLDERRHRPAGEAGAGRDPGPRHRLARGDLTQHEREVVPAHRLLSGTAESPRRRPGAGVEGARVEGARLPIGRLVGSALAVRPLRAMGAGRGLVIRPLRPGRPVGPPPGTGWHRLGPVPAGGSGHRS